MNKTIRIGAIGSLLLIVMLLVNLTWVQAFTEDKYARNPMNSRNFMEAKMVERGQISAGGEILAESHQNSEGFYDRSYPNMPYSFAPVIGYVSDRYGVAGLEAGFNEELNGESRASGSRFLRTNKENRVGDSIELTFDPQMQAAAYDQLESRGYNGAVVALRPSTGEVLAMASNPSYDPNSIVNPDTAESAWQAVNEDPGQPLLNQAAQEQLPPGSIFKIITTAAGLRAGYTPDSQLTAEAAITLPGTEVQLTNYGGKACGGGGGETSLTQAFTLSCNTAFVELATEIGDEPMREMATAFGVGQNYDLGLPNAAGSLGELEDLAAVGMSAIGQRDVTMTALQAAVMAGTVANDGKRMDPYVVSRVVAPNMKTVSETRPHQAAEAISADEAETLTGLMYSSERNTAGYNGNGYASKTGTAEHGEGLAPHTWYVAFDPDKDVAVAVVVKDGGGMGQSATGGLVSAPIGRAILGVAAAPNTDDTGGAQ
ncbi:penicillin-binding protein 2 [Corynebacterium sp. CCUG 71335]|uniref:penicillin-binding transpeptidase domain-containing protein n=1 Tax=unclassified Corynebacterium TaxID=2624378 RepID=UPI00210BF923|nr:MULTISPECIES: penicillin-binding transpeptidase domain-containing protein [unclassified Corynebacterium]MCQ4620009.1 penicillin-binding protein 2 [Corynebacterium sp. CCUG 71335]MCQ4622969.1 penicillin-binding protein 2 [Corynebacterium sp. CCUG 70398]MCQ4626935.1 penicillin-binding protein 2 [Corynebacterium sp. CCUG 65737]